jgi:predicted nuclease with TOPRIM domain
MKKSEQLLAELNALKARQIELREERSAIDQRSKEISEELNDLEPLYSHGYGKIRRAKGAYEEALMEEQDELLPSPVWIKESKYGVNLSPKVISRVTSKRV